MNPKCPWCGGKVRVEGEDVYWWHECTNECYVSSTKFISYDEALAAASKRFMPKRSVEEIEAFCEKLDVEKQKQWKLCVRDNNMSMGFMEFLKRMQFIRIADYMTGVTE